MERSSLPQLAKNCDKTVPLTDSTVEVIPDECEAKPDDIQKKFPEKVSRSNLKNKEAFLGTGSSKAPPTSFSYEASRRAIESFLSTCQIPGPSSSKTNESSIFARKNESTKVTNTDTAKGKPKVDIDRINELDSFGNQNQYYQFPCSRTFTNHLLKPQSELLRKTPREKEPIAGSSGSSKKKRTKLNSIGSSESALEEAKSIANCILENSLNRIDSNREIKFIEDHLVMAKQKQKAETKSTDSADKTSVDIEAVSVIECINVDSTLSVNEIEYVDVDDDVTNGFLEDTEILTVANIPEPELEVARASREALFDPDSQVDLLDDFEIPPLIPEFLTITQSTSNTDNNFVLIGVNLNINEENEADDDNGFPDWLLQIMLGGGNPGPEEESHDEPHFYCQGDGLGVHPSVIAVGIDDEDGLSTDSSTNSSQEFTEPETELPQNDIGSIVEIPTDIPENQNESENAIEAQLSFSDDEFFDTIDG